MAGIETTFYALSVPRDYLPSDFPSLIKRCTEKTKAKIQSLRFPHDQHVALFSELLLKAILEKNFLIDIYSDISFGENGKPLLNRDGIDFNLSHSGEWILLGVSSRAIGVDIEEIKPFKFEDIGSILSNQEKLVFDATPESQKLSLFYRIWTAKESYLKALGTGITGIRANTLTVKFPTNRIILHQENEMVHNYYFRTLGIDTKYVATVCLKAKNNMKSVTFMQISNII